MSVSKLMIDPLARFLIRRAQLKGPYQLLGRDSQPSDAWKKFECDRLEKGPAAEQSQALPERNATTSATNAASIPMESIDNKIDPRLLHAQPGQWTSPGLSGTLTPTEDQYYRHQNQDLKERSARAQANEPSHQQLHAAACPQGHHAESLHNEIGGISQNLQSAEYHRPIQAQQQQVPSNAQHHFPTQIHPAHIPAYHGPPYPNTSVPHTQPMSAPTAHVYTQTHAARAVQPVKPPRIHPKLAPAPRQLKRDAHFNTLNSPSKVSSRLYTLTKPAGITKPSVSTKPNWTCPEERRADYFAFFKLSKEEKARKLLEIMQKDNISTALDGRLPSPSISGKSLYSPTTATHQTARKGMATPPSSPTQPSLQGISVAAPSYQPSPYANQGFANHPGFSNIVSKFPTPQYHGLPVVPAQQKEKVVSGLSFGGKAKKK